jgi:hypothetical protein
MLQGKLDVKKKGERIGTKGERNRMPHAACRRPPAARGNAGHFYEEPPQDIGGFGSIVRNPADPTRVLLPSAVPG